VHELAQPYVSHPCFVSLRPPFPPLLPYPDGAVAACHPAARVNCPPAKATRVNALRLSRCGGPLPEVPAPAECWLEVHPAGRQSPRPSRSRTPAAGECSTSSREICPERRKGGCGLRRKGKGPQALFATPAHRAPGARQRSDFWELGTHWIYSCRTASNGSTLAARRAGIYDASKATAMIATVARAKGAAVWTGKF
jgi:hypothetical protein